MAVYLSPFGGVGAQFFDNTGNPLAGGKIFSYASGTNTPQATYTTYLGNIAHSNPIILDAAGRTPAGGEIWLDVTQVYKFVLQTSTNVLIGTFDNIIGTGSLVFTIDNFTGNGVQLVFNLSNTPYSKDITFVYINGVYQNKNTYNIVGSTLVFTTAPPITSSIEIMYLQVIQPVGVDDFVGNGSTTIFTLSGSPATENATFVFINGVYQQKNTYTVAGTTFTFSTAPPITSIIEVVYT